MLKVSFIDLIEKEILMKFPKNYSYKFHAQKYPLKRIITGIINVLKYSLPWTYQYEGICGKTLYYHFRRFSENNIFKEIYQKLLKKYSSYNPHRKFRFILLDSTMIINQNGTHMAMRNKLMKNKKVTKISAVTDKNGIPLSLLMANGSTHDLKIGEAHFDNFLIGIEKINKHKCTLLADSAYDSKNFYEKIAEKGITHLIDRNPRNTKNAEKIKRFTKTELAHYKKRIKIENFFAHLKKFRRLLIRVDRQEVTFMNFIFLACICNLIRKN